MHGVTAEEENYSELLEEAHEDFQREEELVADGGSEINYEGSYGTSAELFTGLGILAGSYGIVAAEPKFMGMGAVTLYLANQLRKADSDLEEYDELLNSE